MDYFKFNLYGDSWGEYAERGKYIFQNRDNKIKARNVLPFLVFHFVVNYNLADLELFFKLAGFSTFTEEELPRSIVIPVDIGLTNRNKVYAGCFGGYTDEEEAIKYIEAELGEGIIARFRDIKTKQLECQKEQLLEQLRKNARELEFQSFACGMFNNQQQCK